MAIFDLIFDFEDRRWGLFHQGPDGHLRPNLRLRRSQMGELFRSSGSKNKDRGLFEDGGSSKRREGSSKNPSIFEEHLLSSKNFSSPKDSLLSFFGPENRKKKHNLRSSQPRIEETTIFQLRLSAPKIEEPSHLRSSASKNGSKISRKTAGCDFVEDTALFENRQGGSSIFRVRRTKNLPFSTIMARTKRRTLPSSNLSTKRSKNFIHLLLLPIPRPSTSGHQLLSATLRCGSSDQSSTLEIGSKIDIDPTRFFDLRGRRINLSNPKPGHTTGGSGRGARRGGGAGSVRTGRPGDKRPSYPPKHRRHVA